jgi:hypothetical protein
VNLRDRSVPADPGVGLDDALTLFLVDCLQDYHIGSFQEPPREATLDDVLLVADKSRSAATHKKGGSVSPYAQRRDLLEAVSAMLGGPDTLIKVGQSFFDSIRNPERVELLQSLGSPAAVYEALPQIIQQLRLAFEMRTEVLAADECRIEIRMRTPYAPFPELCAFGFGLASTVPELFGLPAAEVARESCQCEGAAACSAKLHWSSAGAEETPAGLARVRERLQQARRKGADRANRPSGDDIQPVLTRVVKGSTAQERPPRA